MSFLLTNQKKILAETTPLWIQDNLLAGLIVAGYDEKKGGQADSGSHGWSPLWFFFIKNQANLKNRCTPSHWVVHVFVSLGHVMVLALDTSRVSLMPTFDPETGQQVFVLPGFAAGELIIFCGRQIRGNSILWDDMIHSILFCSCSWSAIWSFCEV